MGARASGPGDAVTGISRTDSVSVCVINVVPMFSGSQLQWSAGACEARRSDVGVVGIAKDRMPIVRNRRLTHRRAIFPHLSADTMVLLRARFERNQALCAPNTGRVFVTIRLHVP